MTGYTFTPAAKARLGSLFLSCIETGRFKYWSREDQPLQDGWWFYRQAEACTYHIPPGGQFDKHLQWSVPASAKISTPAGPKPIHDDRLLSAALIALCDDLPAAGALLFTGSSTVARLLRQQRAISGEAADTLTEALITALPAG